MYKQFTYMYSTPDLSLPDPGMAFIRASEERETQVYHSFRLDFILGSVRARQTPARNKGCKRPQDYGTLHALVCCWQSFTREGGIPTIPRRFRNGLVGVVTRSVTTACASLCVIQWKKCACCVYVHIHEEKCRRFTNPCSRITPRELSPILERLMFHCAYNSTTAVSEPT